VILPGVGAFKAAMKELEKRNLVEVLKQVAANKTPILGICLGMQLLFDSSQEYGFSKGLGLIEGKIEQIPDKGLKIPQMGWNQNEIKQTSSFDEVDKQYTYFVHSYYANCQSKNIISTVDYGIEIPSIVQNKNIVGMQFHPEKSGSVGLNLLKNFQKMVSANDFSSN
jgi:imidazole glycerol phosphate synthase, glutamine amidotransferase subunit